MKEKIREILSNHTHFYIVGAQSRAKTLAGQLSFLYPENFVEAYLVNDLQENDVQIQGIPVLLLAEEKDYQIEYPVFIATKGIYHVEIEETLRQKGFQTIIPVTVDVDNGLRNAYVEKVFQRENRSFCKLNQLECTELIKRKERACVYVASSIYDKPLNTEYIYPSYEKPIQVGAALTEDRLKTDILTDNTGDNISEKNRQYCELTALYWIWKNAKEPIIGLAHYRRHFILGEHWLERMLSNHVDVVLPVPTYVQPSIRENYQERHDPSDWDYLMEYLKEYYPQDYELGKKVFAGNLYFPCNMFIMRKDVLNELCSWMFPILDAVTVHGGAKADTYMNRYTGFISERLITLFFHRNREKYKIVYADKNFLR